MEFIVNIKFFYWSVEHNQSHVMCMCVCACVNVAFLEALPGQAMCYVVCSSALNEVSGIVEVEVVLWTVSLLRVASP